MSEPRGAASRSTLSLLFRSPLVFSILCPLSVPVTGLFIGGLWTPDRLRLWHLLMVFQPALWFASVLVVLQDFRHHRQDWPVRRSARTAVVLCTLLAWVMNSFPFAVQLLTQRWALPDGLETVLQVPHARARLLALGMLSAVVSTMHVAGMLNVHVQLLTHSWEPAVRGEAPEAGGLHDEVLHYQRLRSRLSRFLVFSAVTIGLTALSFGAFRNLLTELSPSLAGRVEPSSLMSYGLYYTGLLASVYLPTRKTLTEVGQALAVRFVRQSPAAGTSWKDWTQEQAAVHTWLGLQSTALQDFQQGLTVLTPLLASLSGLALGMGG